MEESGEVRGGRFVDGFSGEQFALPEALGLLRKAIETDRRPQYTVISACDPLNLGGMITQGVKTPAITGNRILLENGLPVARTLAEELEEFSGISAEAGHQARKRLLVVRHWHETGVIQ
jgi:ATP-dependent Lhr-like helicase